ncbi:MAG: gliding motility-associated C-terminal domain-containing protein [Bacteroidetes bacterium]|nr:gliding motility-associated C-terminal domain-containing protein [Bacteroidota bacterium]
MHRYTNRHIYLFTFIFWVFLSKVNSQIIDIPEIQNVNDTDITCKPSCLVSYTQSLSFPIKTTTSYNISTIPFTPFPTTGTNILGTVDDEFSNPVNIGFCFSFFGTSYTQCLISSNGTINFDMTNAGTFNSYVLSAPLPSSTAMPDMRNSILGPVHDIDVSKGGSIKYALYGTAPFRAFAVTWDNIPMFGSTSIFGNPTCPGVTNAKQQIIIYETTNMIDIYIWDKDVCSGWNSGAAVEGIQNAAGTVAFIVPGRNHPTQWTATNDAKRFTPDGTDVAIQYEWRNDTALVSNNAILNVCPCVTDTFLAKAKVVINGNCTTTAIITKTVVVTNNVLPTESSFTPDYSEVTLDSSKVNFTNTSDNATTYLWSFGDAANSTSTEADPTFYYTSPGVYTVTLVSCNCNQPSCCDTLVQEILIQVEPTLFTANTFSPNNDNLNDIWIPKHAGSKAIDIKIYNRWGELIFETNDLLTGWNGKINNTGADVAVGVYVWKMKYLDINNSETEAIGHVTLIR